MSNPWYYLVDDQQQGPVAEEVLQEWITQGRLGNEDYIWRHGMADWKTVRDVFGPDITAGRFTQVDREAPVAPEIARRSTVASPMPSAPPPIGTTSARRAEADVFQIPTATASVFGLASEGSQVAGRPGGLTVLALANLVWGALGLYGCAMVLYGLVPVLQTNTYASSAFLPLLMLLLKFASEVMLIISGVGYLKLKRGMGLMLGRVWAVYALIATACNVLVSVHFFGVDYFLGAPGVWVVVGIVYAILTLVLLSTTFKNAFLKG